MCKEYYIKFDDQRVPVTEEVYRAYKRPEWRERKDRQSHSNRELSLDMMIETGFEIADDSASIAEVLEEKELLYMLNKALDELDDDEWFLITELFYKNKTEREVAIDTGRAKTSIHKAKVNILLKLKKILEKR